MNKLWILIVSAMVFIPVFSYAEEEKCDQAVIDAGVELTESYVKARDSSPEYVAYREAREVMVETREAYNKTLTSFNAASYTFHKAVKSLSEGQVYDSFVKANDSCKQELEDAYGKRQRELRESRSSRSNQSGSSSTSGRSQGNRSGSKSKGVQ